MTTRNTRGQGPSNAERAAEMDLSLEEYYALTLSAAAKSAGNTQPQQPKELQAPSASPLTGGSTSSRNTMEVDPMDNTQPEPEAVPVPMDIDTDDESTDKSFEEATEKSGDSDHDKVPEDVIIITDGSDEDEPEEEARLTYVGIKPEHRTPLTQALKLYPSDVFDAVKHLLDIKKEGTAKEGPAKESTVTKKKKTITLVKYLSPAPPTKKHQLTFHVPTVQALKEAITGIEKEGLSSLEVMTARTWDVFQIASGKLSPDQLFMLFAQYLIIGATAPRRSDSDEMDKWMRILRTDKRKRVTSFFTACKNWARLCHEFGVGLIAYHALLAGRASATFAELCTDEVFLDIKEKVDSRELTVPTTQFDEEVADRLKRCYDGFDIANIQPHVIAVEGGRRLTQNCRCSKFISVMVAGLRSHKKAANPPKKAANLPKKQKDIEAAATRVPNAAVTAAGSPGDPERREDNLAVEAENTTYGRNKRRKTMAGLSDSDSEERSSEDDFAEDADSDSQSPNESRRHGFLDEHSTGKVPRKLAPIGKSFDKTAEARRKNQELATGFLPQRKVSDIPVQNRDDHAPVYPTDNMPSDGVRDNGLQNFLSKLINRMDKQEQRMEFILQAVNSPSRRRVDQLQDSPSRRRMDQLQDSPSRRGRRVDQIQDGRLSRSSSVLSSASSAQTGFTDFGSECDETESSHSEVNDRIVKAVKRRCLMEDPFVLSIVRNNWVKEAWKQDPAGRRLQPGMKRFDLDMKTVTTRISKDLENIRSNFTSKAHIFLRETIPRMTKAQSSSSIQDVCTELLASRRWLWGSVKSNNAGGWIVKKLSSPILRHFIFTLFFKGTNKAYGHSLDLDMTTTVLAIGAALLGMLIERGAQTGFPTPKPGARIPNASITKESWQAAYEIYHRQVIAKHESNPDWLAAEWPFYLLGFNAVHEPAPSAIDMSSSEDDMDQEGFE
ncbi:hypothetical protein HDU89_000956 [Geranomyces variabilis]|nr:hypothetical protein HDU89_000956 [Geranomyces variabilis]